jgi:tRNA nucleotidyltransferase (CCA-adding enzyme)
MTDPVPQPPGYVLWAAKTLEEAGYETWAVGGSIRNTLLGIPTEDWDLATRAHPGVVRRLFPRTVPLGIEHGTVGVLTRGGVMLEVTTFRKDVETFGRHAVVEFAEDLREDLSRRDFTVNAIAWHPLTGEYRDPFDGRVDLAAGLLRTVGNPVDRFAEDYLRVLRALRFSGRFSFKIHEDTWDALRGADGELGILSHERVREELLKILSDDPAPSRALSLYRLSGVLDALYPEIAVGKGCERPGHPEDLWVHSLLLMDFLPPSRPLLRLAAFFQGVGLPEALEGEGFLGDEGNDPLIRSRERTAALMIRLRFSNAQVREVSELLGAGLEAPVHLKTGGEWRRWLHRAGPHHLTSLSRIWLAKARLDWDRWQIPGEPVLRLLKALRREVKSGVALEQGDLAFDGRDLISMGLKPGPDFGMILADLMNRVLDDPTQNDPETLRSIVQDWIDRETHG